MSISAPAPPLLLTKRITTFLRSNLSSQVHTLLLSTETGKLLSHASQCPVSTLRTQSTVAASIWATYQTPATQEAIPEALPPQTPHHNAEPKTVTIQLAAGVLVVRKLKCGLLFVAIGSSADGNGGEQSESARGIHVPGQAALNTSQAHATSSTGSPSEVASLASAGAATTTSVTTTNSVAAAGVVLIRRQAEELARWLEDKLGSLGVPEDNPSTETR